LLLACHVWAHVRQTALLAFIGSCGCAFGQLSIIIFALLQAELCSRPKDLLIVACLPSLGSFVPNGFLLRHFRLMAILFGLVASPSSKIF
jgi:hypothetical protein